jgi:hypothetical protein
MILFEKTAYESMKYDAEDLEHWDCEENIFKNFESRVEFENGFRYRLFVKSMLSDGLSVPKVFRNFIERYGWYLAAGLEHDLLYISEAFWRFLADLIFVSKMQYKDRNGRGHRPRLRGLVSRDVSWVAVRVGGLSVWNAHDPEVVRRIREQMWIEIDRDSCLNRLHDRIKRWEDKQGSNNLPSVIRVTDGFI